MNFANKKILFIGPIFHNYHTAIIAKLEEKGASVFFFPERKYGFIFKILNNFSRNLLVKYQGLHYKQILKKINTENFDYLFVIRGYMIPINFISQIKHRYPNIKTIMYQWDAIRDNDYSAVIHLFDKSITFDYVDSSNLKIGYLPLFYTNEIERLRKYTDYKYDVFILSWYIKERYDLINKFVEANKNEECSMKILVYIPFSSYLKEILKFNFINLKYITFKPVERNSYLRYLSESRSIIDFSKKNQTGLAIRIIESIGAGRKIITDSMNIKNEIFYSKELVYCIEHSNLHIEKDFFEASLIDKELQTKISEYSIDRWVEKIFA